MCLDSFWKAIFDSYLRKCICRINRMTESTTETGFRDPKQHNRVVISNDFRATFIARSKIRDKKETSLYIVYDLIARFFDRIRKDVMTHGGISLS